VTLVLTLIRVFDAFSKLRLSFRAIQAIKNVSGWTWSDECGADITPELEDEWATFLVANKHAKPFKNRGWNHLEKMVDIMPVTIRGAHVFHASQGVTGLDSDPGELLDQDDDNEDEEDSQEKDKENKVCLSYSVVYLVLTFNRLPLLFRPPLAFENVNVQPLLHPPPSSKERS
jgi:hypothetical protein